MSQESALFGVGRVRALEKKLIGRDRMQQLIDSTYEEGTRMLFDIGYGAGADGVEAQMNAELAAAAKLVREVSPDDALTDAFLLGTDMLNLKLLIKLKLLGSSETPMLSAGGLFTEAEVRRMAADSAYGMLPAALGKAVAEVELRAAAGKDPQALAIGIDRAYFAYVSSLNRPFLTRYFGAKADFDNMLAVLRLKRMDAGAERVREVMLPGGGIGERALTAAYDAQPDMLAKLVGLSSPAGDALKAALTEYAKTGSLSELERARDNALMAMAREHKADTDTVAPIIGYYIAREREARQIHLILTLRRNNTAEETVAERLRELYG